MSLPLLLVSVNSDSSGSVPVEEGLVSYIHLQQGSSARVTDLKSGAGECRWTTVHLIWSNFVELSHQSHWYHLVIHRFKSALIHINEHGNSVCMNHEFSLQFLFYTSFWDNQCCSLHVDIKSWGQKDHRRFRFHDTQKTRQT